MNNRRSDLRVVPLVTGLAALLPLGWPAAPFPATRYQEAPVAQPTAATVERRTADFVIVYAPAASPAVDELSSFADDVLRGFTSGLSVTLAVPITVRVHQTRAGLIETVPLAAEIDGVLVTSPRAARELHIVAADGHLRDALRHALGSLTATTLGAGAVPDLWASGFADFVARPDAATAAGVARLRTARDTGQLRPWSDLGTAGSAFLDPPVTHPEALAAVSFLADRGGVVSVVRFLEEIGAGSAWPAALESAYGVTATELEAEWASWLGDYLDGGWQRHPLFPGDASEIETLLAAGRYGRAADAARAAGGFAGVDDPAVGGALAAAGDRAQARSVARRDLLDADQALADGRYAEALAAAQAAQAGLEKVPDAELESAANELARRATMGLSAEGDLVAANAASLVGAPLAALKTVRARGALAALGSESGAVRAQEIKANFDRVLGPLGVGLIGAGALILGRNAVRRRADAVA